MNKLASMIAGAAALLALAGPVFAGSAIEGTVITVPENSTAGQLASLFHAQRSLDTAWWPRAADNELRFYDAYVACLTGGVWSGFPLDTDEAANRCEPVARLVIQECQKDSIERGETPDDCARLPWGIRRVLNYTIVSVGK